MSRAGVLAALASLAGDARAGLAPPLSRSKGRRPRRGRRSGRRLGYRMAAP